MSEIKLSALVTFYNQEEYVDRAMQSILMQKTDFDYEILVGDDGSDDGTVEKVQKWIERYPNKIKLFIMPRDRNETYFGSFRFCQNRLNLLNHVQGKYFATLDGDDYYTVDDKFQRQVDILEDKRNADCVACAHDLEKVYPNGRKKRVCAGRLTERKISPKDYWINYYLSAENFIVRSEIIKKIPQELLGNVFEDIIQTFFVIQYGNIYYIPESMVAYVQTGEGLWTTGNQALNSVSNMLRYDYAIIINPKMKSATDKKFANIWRGIFRVRKQLSAEKFPIFYREAKEKNLVNTLAWLNYNQLSVVEKVKLFIKTVSKINLIQYKTKGIQWLINKKLYK